MRRAGAIEAVEMYLVHQAPKTTVRTMAVAPGVRGMPWQDFVKEL